MSFTNQYVKMSDKQNIGAGGNPPVLHSDITSLIQDAAATNNQEPIPWDNKQWRDELKIAQSKLLHKKFDPGEDCPSTTTPNKMLWRWPELFRVLTVLDAAAYRDPMNKPLVPNPHGLTAELEQRLRKCYENAMARNH